jgi:hypothetical protein
MNRHTLEAIAASDTNPLVASIVETLCAIDFELRTELERLQASDTSPEVKWLIGEKLKANHRERREPYIRGLAKLHRAKMARTSSNGLAASDEPRRACGDRPDPIEATTSNRREPYRPSSARLRAKMSLPSSESSPSSGGRSAKLWRASLNVRE